jgi:predicted ATPase
MAIRRIRLRNFKCFADSGDIPLTPLTVIFGRNNTGKSSILQSLFLLRQTLDSPEYGPRLDLRGPLYHAGTYADVVHQHKASENVVMEFDVTLEPDGKLAGIVFEFKSDEPQPPRLVRLRVETPDADALEIRRGKGQGGPYELHIAGKSLGVERKALFRFPQNGFLPLIGPEPPRVGAPSLRRETSRESARLTLGYFETALRAMRAVGPFRRQPDRRYEYQGRVADTIDATGRSVVDALIEDITRRGKKRGELFRSVNRWLMAVGHVRILPPKRISRAARLFEVRLKDMDSGKWANFADVGFGIGQALPVLVEGLRTPPEGLFVVQEPEIHLHPDAQLQMADFLLDLTSSGRQVIVETHSEHFLLRIRRALLRKGAGKPRLGPGEVGIIYVEKSKDGTSRAIPLEMDAMAQITHWPQGFMEEATEERMAILREMAGSSSEE